MRADLEPATVFLLLRKSEVLLSRHNTSGICVAFAAAPSLDADYKVAFVQDAKLDGLRDAPYQTLVNILLPVGTLEVRLGFWEEERIDAAIKVRILPCVSI